MLWLICSLAVVVLVAIGVKMYLSDRGNVSRVVLVLGCLFAATYIAYIPPFYCAYGLLAGAVGDLNHTLRIVTVDADVTQYYDVVYQNLNTTVLAQGYIAMLGILHIALPALSALTAVTVLLRCFSSMQLFFCKQTQAPNVRFLGSQRAVAAPGKEPAEYQMRRCVCKKYGRISQWRISRKARLCT